MADACAVSAIAAGADEIKAAAYCVDSVSVAHMAKLLAAKASEFDVSTTIQTTQMNRILSQVTWMCQTGRSQTSPFDTGVQAAGGAKQTMQTQNFIDIAALFGLTLPEKFLKD